MNRFFLKILFSTLIALSIFSPQEVFAEYREIRSTLALSGPVLEVTVLDSQGYRLEGAEVIIQDNFRHFISGNKTARHTESDGVAYFGKTAFKMFTMKNRSQLGQTFWQRYDQNDFRTNVAKHYDHSKFKLRILVEAPGHQRAIYNLRIPLNKISKFTVHMRLPQAEKKLEEKVISIRHPEIAFPQKGSFNWFGGEPELPEDQRIDREKLEMRIRFILTEELKKRGYELAVNQPADFLLRYEVFLDGDLEFLEKDERVDLSLLDSLAIQEERARLEEGALFLDFVDRETNKLIWRGLYRKDIQVVVSEEKEKRLREAIVEVLHQLPA